LRGNHSAPAVAHKLGSALGRPRRGLILPAPPGVPQREQKRGALALPETPGQEKVGEVRLYLLPPRRPDFEGRMNIQITSIPTSAAFPNLMAYLICALEEQNRGCSGPC